MTLIIQNANLDNMAKTPQAVAEYIKKYGGKKRVTVEWISKNGAVVYSSGEKDKITVNVR